MKLYDDGKQYLKSKVSLKVSGSGKVQASFVNGQLSSIGIGPHSFTKEQQYQYSRGQERGGFTSGTNVNLGLQSLGLAASFGYKNHSVEAGVKGEVGYRVAYVKGIHKVKQGFSELTTVNEMGMRSPRDMERIAQAGRLVLAAGVVSIAFVAAISFTAVSFGTGAGVSFTFVISALIYFSSVNEDKNEKNVK